MNNKHKIFILLFVGVFGFVVAKAWIFLTETYLSAGARISTEPKKETADEDTDNDGISDLEESFFYTDFNNPDTDGDGYLDGEELASGYDPRIPAPNDVKPGLISRQARDVNLTKRVTGRILASIYNGEIGSNIPAEDQDAVLDDIVSNTLGEASIVFYTAPLNESDILVFNTREQEDLNKYAEDLLNIVYFYIYPMMSMQQNYFEDLIQTLDDSSFVPRGGIVSLHLMEEASKQLRETRVPAQFVEIHIGLINFVNKYKIIYESMGTPTADPIKTMAGMNTITDLNESLLSFLLKAIDIFDEQKVFVSTESPN